VGTGGARGHAPTAAARGRPARGPAGQVGLNRYWAAWATPGLLLYIWRGISDGSMVIVVLNLSLKPVCQLQLAGFYLPSPSNGWPFLSAPIDANFLGSTTAALPSSDQPRVLLLDQLSH